MNTLKIWVLERAFDALSYTIFTLDTWRDVVFNSLLRAENVE